MQRDHAGLAVIAARNNSLWKSGAFGSGYDRIVGQWLRANARSVTIVGSLADPAAGVPLAWLHDPPPEDRMSTDVAPLLGSGHGEGGIEDQPPVHVGVVPSGARREYRRLRCARACLPCSLRGARREPYQTCGDRRLPDVCRAGASRSGGSRGDAPSDLHRPRATREGRGGRAQARRRADPCPRVARLVPHRGVRRGRRAVGRAR